MIASRITHLASRIPSCLSRSRRCVLRPRRHLVFVSSSHCHAGTVFVSLSEFRLRLCLRHPVSQNFFLPLVEFKEGRSARAQPNLVSAHPLILAVP
jgi:hypothetical protein